MDRHFCKLIFNNGTVLDEGQIRDGRRKEKKMKRGGYQPRKLEKNNYGIMRLHKDAMKGREAKIEKSLATFHRVKMEDIKSKMKKVHYEAYN